jgi:two-component system, sensor histidine kinase and response regulator
MRGAERTRRVPIIFVTAGSRDPQRVFQGYESGAVDFLFKPIEPHILNSKVDVFLELADQRRRATHALRLNELFVAVVGHDLRNPLAAMLSAAEVLGQQLSDERQLRTLRRMTSAGKRMTAMIDQLLDLTRARLGGGLGFVWVREPVELGELVKRAVDELRASHPGREIALSSAHDTTLTGDPERLVQLFSNLVGNAVAHGAAATPIAVDVIGRLGDVVVEIRNQGVIPADRIATLFEPFRARPREAPRSSGLGLGLFISYQIAAGHGGDITVASSAETGTVVTVRLPRGVGTEEPGSHRRSSLRA